MVKTIFQKVEKARLIQRNGSPRAAVTKKSIASMSHGLSIACRHAGGISARGAGGDALVARGRLAMDAASELGSNIPNRTAHLWRADLYELFFKGDIRRPLG
jgi:hypothetical protein